MQGYLNQAEDTAATLRAGRLHTGDVGFLDADGHLFIIDRIKDLIITGGFNVYPKEVEELLDDQPGVLESAVIGVPHADFGETVLGLIVPAPGAAPDLAAIEAATKAALARFKQPRRLIVIDALPRNTMGKVQKNLLRETYADIFAAAG